MALVGQSSGGWTESSGALRVLHGGIANSIGVLTTDALTQANPPVGTPAASAQVDITKKGVLSGSVALTRPDGGSNQIGGPISEAHADKLLCKPLGIFANDAAGNAFENTPGSASGKNTYYSSQGTYGNSLFETKDDGANAVTYKVGDNLICSRNGYLTNQDDNTDGLEKKNGAAASTVIAVLRMPPDSTQNELVYDQRI